MDEKYRELKRLQERIATLEINQSHEANLSHTTNQTNVMNENESSLKQPSKNGERTDSQTTECRTGSKLHNQHHEHLRIFQKTLPNTATYKQDPMNYFVNLTEKKFTYHDFTQTINQKQKSKFCTQSGKT